MKKSKKEQEIIDALESRALAYNIDIVDVNCVGTSSMPNIIVRIDNAGTSQGSITLDEVAHAEAWISEVIEELDPYKLSYNLEVSSPGVDRPLRRVQDFIGREGEKLEIRLLAPLEGTANRRKVTGKLLEIADSYIILECEDGEQFSIYFDDIEAARVRAEFTF